MAIHAAICHRTTYTYDRATTIHPQIVRLRPAPHSRTPIISYSLTVKPEGHFLNWQQDPFGNYMARLVFPEKSDILEVIVDLVADMTSINPFDFFLEKEVETFPFAYSDEVAAELAPYLVPTDLPPALETLAVDLPPVGEPRTIDYLADINRRLESMVAYEVRLEPGVQSCAQTLEKRSGSCRDSAFLLVQLLRRLGFAARFVSGYLIQLTADEKPIEGASGPTEDFTDLHAWTEVFLPGAGWVGLDPTSGLFAGEGHIPLACTPEPSSAAPISGAIDPCEVSFDFSNQVTRLHEDPRVTKPYSDAVWADIDALGSAVDRRLQSGDVRLTMGGEPTFVSIDDMDGEEWNTAADGTAKRRLAADLARRLLPAFAPGGLLWCGEGKWYPGEPVPRWAYGVLWRKDGYPIWRDPGLLADPSSPGTAGDDSAASLVSAIAKALGLDPSNALPALEDVDYYRWKISTLPKDEDVTVAAEDDSLERRTLAQLEARGLNVPTGHVFPVCYRDGRWISAAWELRRPSLYLIPGASAMGFRLPLDSVRKATELDSIEPPSPMEADFPPLDPDPLGNTSPASRSDEDDGWIPRTALTVENRDGRLHVFLPPTASLQAYLQLIAAVETAASATGFKVIIEGYEAPHDPRIERLGVTPDPGVIEINIHPSRDWQELRDRTTRLYEEARLSRLGAEKFMLDGRHTGTGGGNHVVIGGATPADSPFLRRPDLLASVVAFWQNHPGLSYLFSGLFIGPTSQAPRIDESRDDRLFEVDIALASLRKGVDEPGLIDRTMRHLLTDLTGNTHRSELCIDKLYSPDSPTGQLGLLELRAFEMPPHMRMALVQSLLVRSLIVRFWERPYERPLVRWGTALHDRFMLPHFVWEDMIDVCSDLQEAGIDFDCEWLRPFLEFRFPRVGTVRYGSMEIELRTALEPWHVLGEESSAQGTARYVDSSLERLQVRVQGLVEGRHILTCNGHKVSLTPTGTNGEQVGAVRFKAWDPPSALHPSITAQGPLVFDIVDLANTRSLGGCVYHVSHPGGLSYESLPVNALEAEARRSARFWQEGHTPGVIEPLTPTTVREATFEPKPAGNGPVSIARTAPPHPEFPHTLDLRSSS